MRQRLAEIRGALAVLAAIQFVSSLGIAIMLPLIPLYALSLGAEPLQLGLLTSLFAITSAASQLGSGFLIDRLGARSLIRGGIGVYAGANVLIALAGNATQLLAFRGIAGLGGGANLISTRVYVAQAARSTSLAFTNSVLSAANSAGNVLGPALGGLVAAASDLHGPFFVVGLTSGIAFVGSLFLPRPVAPAGGQVLHPEATGSIFGRTVLTLLVANLFLLIGFGGFITTYAPFATQRLGWSTVEVGIIWSIFGVGDITLGPWLGHLADRTGRRRMAALATIPIGLFGLSLVLGLPRPVIYAITFVTGSALTAFNASWFAMLTTAVTPERRGRIFGIVSAVANVGVVIGGTSASVLWQLYDLSGGLVLASAACFCTGLVLLTLPRGAQWSASPLGASSSAR